MLRCAAGQIVVEYQKEAMQKLPQLQVERILLLGSVGMTTGFLNFAMQKRIPVTFLSQEGQYKGRLESGGRRHIALRLAQFRGLEDTNWRLSLAKEIVRAKIGAQKALLGRCGRNHPQAALTQALVRLDASLADVATAATLPELMGQGGRAARAYFQALPFALRRPLPFQGRNRRPPKDPVNALLSLGYGLLTAEIIGALVGAGLDSQIGVFHSSQGRMPALAEDLLEMFRPPVADGLALALVNLGVMRSGIYETGRRMAGCC